MGFEEVEEKSTYRQFESLVLAGTENPNMPRLKRTNRSFSHADGMQVKSYSSYQRPAVSLL